MNMLGRIFHWVQSKLNNFSVGPVPVEKWYITSFFIYKVIFIFQMGLYPMKNETVNKKSIGKERKIKWKIIKMIIQK